MMTRRPRALDLFCGAGGASMGLHKAGFEVTGVDLAPQPRYPFTFIQGDALDPPIDISLFDFIWASPPCQAHSAMRTMHNAKQHVDLIAQTRALLKWAHVPYAIENVEGAPLQNPITLCGTMFDLGCEGAELRRHRLFECSFPIEAPQCQHDELQDVIGIYGGHVRNRRRREGSKDRGLRDFTPAQAREAMQLEHMTLKELSLAIPPAYSEYIGRAALADTQRTARNDEARQAA